MATKDTAVAVKDSNALPDYLRNITKKAVLGNIDRSDIIIPRVKLLQAISPEVADFDNAKAGEFWHTVAGVSLGKSVRMVPIILRKSYVLWSPRNDDRGILARASDGVNWDTPDMEFTVKPKGSSKEVTYKLGKTVVGSGLDRFGSAVPDDPSSPPAAALTYELLLLFPDFIELGPAVVINTRSSVKPAKDFINKTMMRPVDHYYQQYTMTSVQAKSSEGMYNNYQYIPDGYAAEEVGMKAKEMYEYYSTTSFRANEENEETETEPTSDKF